ncbi:MAG: aminopeptidase P family protein [Oscillospiraceae bacterium]|nr:aminopeptidase P family protein [Oscillospiraceae bacterium]
MNRVSKMRAQLRAANVDAFLLCSAESRQYASGYQLSEGVAILADAGCRYFTDSRYIEAAEQNITGFGVQQIDREHTLASLLADAIRSFGVKTLGYEDGVLTASQLQKFKEQLPAELVPAQAAISAPRKSKEPCEIELLKKAQEITDRAFADLLNVIQAGMTEKELQAELIYRLYKFGGEGLSFDPIVVSGANTSMPHGVAGDKPLAFGEFVTMDFGCKFGGYCSDMTRTVALGFISDEMHKVYDTVLSAQEAGIAAAKAGVCGKEVDGAARRIIEDAGYGAYFGHAFGHSLGLEIHESPNCSPASEDPMPLGAVCSAEPGIYLPGKFGVRIEDVIVFRDGGCEDITRSPKKLLIV